MAAPMLECCCHITDCTDEPILPVSDVSWGRICECMNLWASLDGKEKEIACVFNSTSRDTSGFHRVCYQRFTNKKRIEQGVKRKDKGCLRPADSDTNISKIPSSPKKLKCILRSSLGRDKVVVRRSKHVLPEECIICQKRKVIIDKRTLKRNVEALVTCETYAEKLLQAAKLKGDSRILLQIGDVDPVCIEVRYHSSCYKQYTKCVYDKKAALGRPLSNAFDTLCTNVIEKRIITNKEVLPMNLLTKLFITCAKEVDSVDISGYRNYQLKQRLIKKYPNLKYTQPDKITCEFVYHQTDDDSLIHFREYESKNNSSDSETESDSDSDSHGFDYEEIERPSAEDHSEQQQFAQLFRAAVIIRTAIANSQSVSNWPPSAENSAIQECKKVVPPILLNFLAWCTGISHEFSIETVEIESNESQKKILSLAQDIIYLASQGRKLMPKHLALGMTIRHMTGSAKLQHLLNSFGH